MIENKKRKTLKEIAKGEFEHARGTYHLKMLKDAQQRFTARIGNTDSEIKRLSVERNNAIELGKTQLRQKLERHLISTRIIEIPGIGNALGSTILHCVYKGNLTDLYHASSYQGIGESKQYGINAWVQKYQNQIPALLQQDFPGKSEIVKQTADKMAGLEVQINQLKAIKYQDESKLNGIVKWIEYLGKVTAEDFIKARVYHLGDFSNIEIYLNGVFPEWEPMPDWFKYIISGGNDVR
jgi:hypothetical protein